MKSFQASLWLLLLLPFASSFADDAAMASSAGDEHVDTAVVKLATQAYLFSYPLLTMYYTHEVSTNVPQNNGVGKAPLNQWAGMHQFPKAGFTDVVRPNVDTYYSVVFADLDEGPLYLSIPATSRYYLMPILNAYGDVIQSLGTRTTGQGALEIAFVGPDYQGAIDSDLMVIRSSTDLNWMLGRVAVKNDEDGLAEVANFQARLVARPLAERNNPDYQAPLGEVDPKLAGMIPMQMVDQMDLTSYLNQAMQLLVENPPYAADQPLLEQLSAIGFEPGGQFELERFNAATQAALGQVPAQVQAQFAKMTAAPPVNNLQNGWNVITSGLGDYGTQYFLRAYTTKIGYGANQAVDAVYPNAAVDSEGQPFSGSHRYLLHFDADKMPPVEGFWSLTLYDKKGFLVANPINRYNLGSMKDLTYNADGSLDLLIQADAPADDRSNWLPSPPAGQGFELTFRMYYPKESVVSRSYVMPGVERLD